MRRQVLVSILLLISTASFARAGDLSAFAFSGLVWDDTSIYKPGELIVRFSGTDRPPAPGGAGAPIVGPLTKRAVRSKISDYIVSGASVHKEYDRIVPGLTLVKLPEGTSVLDALIRFNRSANILYAEPNYKIRALQPVIPNDPRFREQWGLNNTGQTGGIPDADIDAPEAWEIETSASNIIVAVLDTGINYTHPDLAANMWINPGEVSQPGVVGPNDFNNVDDDGNGYVDDIYGYDFVDDDGDPNDENFHGTHVAGIIGAVGDNGIGVAGVCWRVKLMAVRILDADGRGTIEGAIDGIDYAVAMDVNVINASWGTYTYSFALYDAIASAGDAKILFVAAAGNDGYPFADYPAGYGLDNIISVMATNDFDMRALFSNYSPVEVDLGAPGENILSTFPTYDTNAITNPPGGLPPYSTDYETISGTSMAAPFVSGACALVKKVRPQFTYTQIKTIILRSVDPVLRGLCVSDGRLNLFNAVSMARPGRVLNATTGIMYGTIQAALDAAKDKEKIIADANYWYFENIDFKGLKVKLRSGDVNSPPGYGVVSPTTTYISGLFNTDYVVRLDSGENVNTILTGFTITDGRTGSIHVSNSSPTITDCIITENNGGIYCYNAPKPTITNCTITNNSQSSGGIYCHNSSPTITNCTISANTTWNSGGGIYCDGGSDPNITNCLITGNTTDGQGGGIYSDETSDPNISNCTITLNWARWEGGGIYCVGGPPEIIDCNISGNVTEWDGGGIYCDGSEPNIRNCTIINNFAYYDGGGIYLNGSSPLIKNCLIAGNAVDSWDCGGVFCWDASPPITNCTFAHNRSNNFDGVGGALYCLGTSNPKVTNCIFSDNNDIAIYESEPASDPNVRWCLFYNNPDGDYYDFGTGLYKGPSQVGSIPGGSNNLYGNPMFVRGRLGSYYLSQFPAGQILDANSVPVDPNVNPADANSPAVDAGSADANALGMHIYSTRTDNFKDAKGNKDFRRVDIGFHYNDPLLPRTFFLTTSATNGTISPPSGNYTQYKQVLLKVAPADPNIYQLKYWLGTDNDASRQLWNIVTMDSNKSVRVQFETILVELRTRVVGGNGTVTPRRGSYPRGTVVNLTATPVNPAHRVKWRKDVDNEFSTLLTNTVTMTNGPYPVKPFRTDLQGREYKEVEVEFYQPRMLDVPGDYTNIQLAISDANDGDIVVIAPGTYSYEPAQHPDGDILVINGKAITVTSVNPDDPCVVAATIINGRFEISNVNRDTVINGLTIRNPVLVQRFMGDPPSGAGNDGISGIGYEGGGMELLYDASPDVRNCRFEGCYVWGAHGSNGNGGVDLRGSPGNGGWAGWARGGAVVCGYFGSPIFTNCSFIDCWARGGDGGNGGADPGGHGGNWEEEGWDGTSWIWDYGPFLPHWKYSGYGGAIYCYPNSAPEFVDCNFTNNQTYGGSCGITGQPYISTWPLNHYKIDSFGGAVYAAEGSSPVFTGCTFIDNESDVNGPTSHFKDDEIPINYDPYISYGGAIAFEDGASPLFIDCSFNNNIATIGGGMWWTWADPNIVDCNFVQNTAFHGGGVYFVGGTAEIARSNFRENEALYDTSIVDPNNPEEVLGEGGAIHCFGADATIVDCNVFNNDAGGSGGGIYISGSAIPLVKNCLITGNYATRDGGGISIDWHSDVNIVNCTIADNEVAGGGYGGGLCSSYNSSVNIINSIIWDNLGNIGAQGLQLAIATGFKYDPRPSTVNVTYSDIQDATDPNAFGAKAEALDLVFCIDTTSSMFDDIDAVKAAARQITNSIAAKFSDFRIAVVDYKDFDEPNFGEPTDYPYRTVLGFTTNTNEVVAALNSLTASGGADWPESVYTALMHCIDHNSLAATLGGTLYGANPASMGPGAWRGGNVLRVIILMGDAPPHDPEPFTGYTLEDIAAAAGGAEPKRIVPLLIGGEPVASSYFRGLANETGGVVLQAAGAAQVVEALMQAIELMSRIPAPIYVGNGCILNWDPNTFAWDPNSHNIDEDPLFIAGYYLSQLDANQPAESNCVDGGSVLASKIGLDTYTTRTDSVPDVNIVDMGYHYELFTVPQYKLTFKAIGVNIIEPIVYPPDYSRFYIWYTTVHLRISSTYDPRYYQVWWTGTDDDSISGPSNTVTMDGDKTVTVRLVKTNYDLTIRVDGGNGRLSARWVEGSSSYTIKDPCTYSVKFGTVVQLTAEPDKGYRVRRWSGTDNDTSRAPNNTVTMNSDRTVSVEFGPPATISVPGDYTTIQEAIGAARDGDVIQIASGVYTTGTAGFVIDKEIMLTSTNPDDPNVVALTVINPMNRAFRFTSNAGPGAVLNGITMANGGFGAIPADDGDNPGENGGDGYGTEGGAIYCETGSSPTIKNCIITDFNLSGGDAGNGADANEALPGGRGGWAGWARGGGVYIAPFSSPTFVNCTISNCTATGGNGGNGGNGAEGTNPYWWQPPGYGGNWSDGILWELWGYEDDYHRYSGYGGGVYCAENSSPTFIACTITGNSTQGGMSGIGGVTPQGNQTDPFQSYEIPSYGGGVYCDVNSTVEFIDCNIMNNEAPKPTDVYHLNPYLGYGGGIAFERTASVTFTNCNISGNVASVGGGMYWAEADPEIVDCNVSGNLAYRGGGMFATKTSGVVENCVIQRNFAGTAPNDVDNVAGQGGGIYCFNADALIVDCSIGHNIANSSGGGSYVSDSEVWFKNCLIINNLAGRDGGGVSANWYANAVLANCTFVGNAAIGTFGAPGNTGLGGGLYASYESDTAVIDSIFWNNYALKGSEMGVGTGFEHDPRPAKLTVSYSDVKGGRPGVQVDTGCTLNWGAGNIDSDPLFVEGMLGSYYLSQKATGEPNQNKDSPCVNTGSDFASNLEMIRWTTPTGEIVGYTTRTDGELERGKVDMGYHYRTVEPCRFCDLIYDGVINFHDFAKLASNWLHTGCSDADGWCHGGDLTFDRVVNAEDLAYLAECWLVEDTEAPIPNPSEWEIEPYLTSSSSIKMIARTAFDEWGWDVEYYFDCVYGNCHDRSWQESPTYQDTGLKTDARYGYRVKARDELGNMTDWSVIRYAGVRDTIPPAPAPTWAVAPYTLPDPNGQTQIAMEATTAYDDSGVSYGFWNVTNDPAGNNIIWQPGQQFIDVNLDPNTTYCYRVKARDGSANLNETAWSVMACATTLLPWDTTPPTPNPAQWDPVADVNGFDGRPRKFYGGGGSLDYYATMTAVQAVDPSGVEYKFVCVRDDPGFSSPWQTSPTYTRLLGGSHVYTEWYVIVRDQSPNRNQTLPSPTLPALLP